MHKLSTTLAVLEHEVSELRLILERQTGILLDTPSDQVATRFAEYLDSKGQVRASDLLDLLRSSAAECEGLLDRLLDFESVFFRFPGAFEALAKMALPEVHRRKSQETPRPLRIWSAGCAAGEEVYSLAISVCEAVNCGVAGWNVHIVGSDIRRQALQIAERGLYPQAALENVPRQLRHTYFSRIGQHFLVKPRLRNLVTFTPMNLAKPGYIGRFDCIFCMDVLPHFSTAQRAALVQRLHLYLEPGGYLFLGQGEKLPAADVAFNPHKISSYTLYQKPLAAAARFGR